MPEFGALVKVAPEKPTKFTARATPGTCRAISDHAAVDRVGAVERGAARQLRHGDQVALVGLRDEARRRLAELVQAEGEHARIDERA